MNSENENLSTRALEIGQSIGSLLRALLLGAAAGVIVGFLTTFFSRAIALATSFREAHPYIMFGLPLAGCAIVFAYRHVEKEDDGGTNMVIEAIRQNHQIPLRVAPLIVFGTVVTHLFGGSSGREGAALQFGGSLGSAAGRALHLTESDEKIAVFCCMSAAFSALFGTPLAAAIFPMEFVSVGIFYYAALVPCVVASYTAHAVAVFMGTSSVRPAWEVPEVPSLYSAMLPKAVLFGCACALVGALFYTMMHLTHRLTGEKIKNPYLRAAFGGACVVILALILRTQAYMGLSTSLLHDAFAGSAPAAAFLLKMVFTALTLSVGFKGGEIVPSLVIGATFGSLFGGFLGIPSALAAAMGMCGVFCAVTNSPIASLAIAFEMFGFSGAGFFAIVIAVSYRMSGYGGLYSAQKIVYSKTENKYIDRQSV